MGSPQIRNIKKHILQPNLKSTTGYAINNLKKQC